MKESPHIVASAAAMVLSLAAASMAIVYANLFEQKYVHSVAALYHVELIKGSAIQRMALNQDDLLLVIGGSEIELLETEYQAYHFFDTYPTGFNVFDVANKGASALTMAQKLAALGGDLRGRKVVVSITPAIVTMAPWGEVNTDHYNSNFSQLQAMELAFSPYVSMETKQLAAKRMLVFADSLQDKPLLKFTLEKLASESVIDHALYSLAVPLGNLQLAVIRMQDHYETWDFIRHRSAEELKVTRKRQQVDWSALAAKAEIEQIKHTDSNPYAVDNLKWKQLEEMFAQPVAPGSKDSEFLDDLELAKEWEDLDLVLRVLRDMGAEPLILSRPMNVPLWERIGVSEQAQNAYYTKLHSVIDPYGIPLMDFKEHDNDPYFNMDLASHTSRKGWVYVDQALDEFFHSDSH